MCRHEPKTVLATDGVQSRRKCTGPVAAAQAQHHRWLNKLTCIFVAILVIPAYTSIKQPQQPGSHVNTGNGVAWAATGYHPRSSHAAECAAPSAVAHLPGGEPGVCHGLRHLMGNDTEHAVHTRVTVGGDIGTRGVGTHVPALGSTHTLPPPVPVMH